MYHHCPQDIWYLPQSSSSIYYNVQLHWPVSTCIKWEAVKLNLVMDAMSKLFAFWIQELPGANVTGHYFQQSQNTLHKQLWWIFIFVVRSPSQLVAGGGYWIPREILMYFDGSYFVIRSCKTRALKMGYSSPKNTEKWGDLVKKGGPIDPLDPPILTGLNKLMKSPFSVQRSHRPWSIPHHSTQEHHIPIISSVRD